MAVVKTKRPLGNEEIAAILEETLSARGAEEWLRANNRVSQGQRPIDLLSEGELGLVRGAARAYVNGAYV